MALITLTDANKHIHFNWFLEPERNRMPPVSFIETFLPVRPSREARPPGLPAYIRFSIENSRGAWPGLSPYNCGEFKWDCIHPTLLAMDPYGAKSRWIELSSGGPKDVTFKTVSNASWVSTSPNHGKIHKDGSTDQRVHINVDWDRVPDGENGEPFNGTAKILFETSDGSNVTVFVPVVKPAAIPEDFKGFIEGDGYVVAEAQHFASNKSVDEYAFQEIEWYGRTVSGLEMYPVSDVNFTLGEGPSLTYDFYTTGASKYSQHNTKGTVDINVQVGPTFNFMLGKKLAFGLQLDNLEPIMITPIPDTATLEHAGTVPKDWPNIVSSEIRNVTASFELPGGNKAGKHTITIWGMTSGLIFERIWVDLGGIAKRGYSYLGPPESRRQ